MVCFDGTLNWKQDLKINKPACFGIAKVKSTMDWDKANDYCKETGGQLPTPIVAETELLHMILTETGLEKAKIPLGFVHEKNKWMQIRNGKKSELDTKLTAPSLEIMQATKAKNNITFNPGNKKDTYETVICEHRNSALSVIEKQKCDDGFVLFAINNASKCYLFHEFADPSMDGNDFQAVSSYCKSQNSELFEPIDSGDLQIMQKIGEASGFAVNTAKHIHKQYGYINQKVRNEKEEPITAAGYKYATVGINITASNSTKALCFMLELPGGSVIQSTCEMKSDFALCVKNSQSMKAKKIRDILGTDSVIITDLKQEVILMEVDDLSELGVAHEAKRTVRMFSTSSILYHIAISVAIFIIL